ncbi:MAG: DUF4124 domain-containing protein [Pseudomonadota bacterium]
MRFHHLVLITALGASAAQAAEVYKWTDAEGNVHFGDKPQAGARAEAVTIPRHTPDPQYLERMQRMREEVERRELEREESQRHQAEQDRVAQTNAARCDQARGTLSMLKEQIRVFSYDKAGNRQYLEDDERAAQIERLQQAIRENCP